MTALLKCKPDCGELKDGKAERRARRLLNFYLSEEGHDKAQGLSDAAHKKLVKGQFAGFESAMCDGLF